VLAVRAALVKKDEIALGIDFREDDVMCVRYDTITCSITTGSAYNIEERIRLAVGSIRAHDHDPQVQDAAIGVVPVFRDVQGTAFSFYSVYCAGFKGQAYSRGLWSWGCRRFGRGHNRRSRGPAAAEQQGEKQEEANKVTHHSSEKKGDQILEERGVWDETGDGNLKKIVLIFYYSTRNVIEIFHISHPRLYTGFNGKCCQASRHSLSSYFLTA
jgi:hypothetical protein